MKDAVIHYVTWAALLATAPACLYTASVSAQPWSIIFAFLAGSIWATLLIVWAAWR